MALTRKSRYTVIAAYVALFAATVGLSPLQRDALGPDHKLVDS